MKTLQEHYNAIKTGQGNKAQFVKQARNLFPEYFNQYTNYDNAVSVLKSKQIISEAAGGVVAKGFDIYDWKKILAEETKSVEKETSKEVLDDQKNAYNNSDMKNADNVNFNEIMKGFYAEMKDPENAKKTGDELKAMVVKNLAKDPLYYTKDGMFGEKGVGYTTEAPGLGKNTQPTSKNASVLGGRDEVNSDSDIVKNSLVGTTKKNVQDTLGNSEAKTSMPKKVKEMPDKGVSGVEKKMKLQEGNLGHNETWSLEPEGRFWILTYSTMDGKKEKTFNSEDEAKNWIEQNLDENTDETLNEASMESSVLNDDFSKDIYVDKNKVKIYISPKLAQSLNSSFFSRGPASYERTKSDLDKAKTTYIKIDPGFRSILRKGLTGANTTELPKKNSDGTVKWVALNLPEKDYDIRITDEKITIYKNKPVEEQKLRSLIRNIINEELNSSEYNNTLFNMEKPHYGDPEALDQIINIYSTHIQSLNSIKKGNK
jgi:hypothetical protein